MSHLQTLFGTSLLDAIGWTLVHSLWQLTLIGLIVGVILAAAPKATAAIRYWISYAALIAMLLSPLATLTWRVASQTNHRTDRSLAQRVIPDSDLATKARPAPASEALTALPPLSHRAASGFFPAVESQPIDSSDPLRSAEAIMPGFGNTLPDHATEDALVPLLSAANPWLVCGWLLGVVVFSLRPLLGLRLIRKLRSETGEPIPAALSELTRQLCGRFQLRRSVQLVQTSLVDVPTLVGHWRPIILLPVSAVTGLTTAQLETIIAHELAHVRRHDYLANGLQLVIETLLFFHPAVWWISKEIRRQREFCCDDQVLALGNHQTTYVRALYALERLRPTNPAPALAATDGPLLARIRRLSGGNPRRSALLSGGWWTTVCLLVTLIVTIGMAVAQEGATPTSAAEHKNDATASHTDPPSDSDDTEKSSPLTWGPSAEGLQAAFKLDSPDHRFRIGSQTKLRFYVRNVSQETIQFSTFQSPFHLDASACLLDAEKNKHRIGAVMYSTLPQREEITLLPGEQVELAAGDFAIGSQTGAFEFKHPIAGDFQGKPGEYSLEFQFNFWPHATPWLMSGMGGLAVPQTNLRTGSVKLTVLPDNIHDADEEPRKLSAPDETSGQIQVRGSLDHPDLSIGNGGPGDTEEELLQPLQQQSSPQNVSIRIQVDAATPYHVVSQLLESLKAAGYEKIMISIAPAMIEIKPSEDPQEPDFLLNGKELSRDDLLNELKQSSESGAKPSAQVWAHASVRMSVVTDLIGKLETLGIRKIRLEIPRLTIAVGRAADSTMLRSLDGKPCDEDELGDQLREAYKKNPQQSVLIEWDSRLPNKQFNALMKMMRETGLTRFQIKLLNHPDGGDAPMWLEAEDQPPAKIDGASGKGKQNESEQQQSLEPGSLSIKVDLPDAGEEVILRLSQSQGAMADAITDPRGFINEFSVANPGEIRIEDLLPGEFRLAQTVKINARYGGHSRKHWFNHQSVKIKSGKTTEIRVACPEGQQLVGGLLGMNPDEFDRIAYLYLIAYRLTVDDHKLAPDRHSVTQQLVLGCEPGRPFVTSRLPPGRYRLVASASEKVTERIEGLTSVRELPIYFGSCEATVGRDGGHVEVDIPMQPTKEVEIRTVDHLGEPLLGPLVPASVGFRPLFDAHPLDPDFAGLVQTFKTTGVHNFVAGEGMPNAHVFQVTAPTMSPRLVQLAELPTWHTDPSKRPELEFQVTFEADHPERSSLIAVKIVNRSDHAYQLTPSDLNLVNETYRVYPPLASEHTGLVVPAKGEKELSLRLDWHRYVRKGVWCLRQSVSDAGSPPSEPAPKGFGYFRLQAGPASSDAIALPLPASFLKRSPQQ